MSTRQKFIAFYTIVHKEFIRVVRIWTQTIIPPLINISLYFLIFGKVIGDRIGFLSVDGVQIKYMEFILPGLVMMSVVLNSYNNVVSSFFGSKFNKSIEELLVSPTPAYIIVMGYCLGGVSRGLIIGSLIIVVSSFFVNFQIQSVFLLFSIMLVCSFLFALGGYLNAVFAKKFDDIVLFPSFILTPLTYLGGIFYSIDMLPSFWKTLSFFNPIFYMVNLFRYSFFDFSYVDVTISFIFVIVFTLVLFSICVFITHKGYKLKT